MRIQHGRLLAVLVLAALAGCSGKKEEGSGSDTGEKAWTKAFDTSLVPPDCFAAIIVHPQRIAQAPPVAGSAEMGELEKSEAFKEMVETIGFDPRELEQLAMLFMPGARGPKDEPGGTLILRWGKPVDGKAIFRKWSKGGDVREDSHAGKTYFTRVPKSETLRKFAGGPACYLPDDRTMVVCPEPGQMQAVLASGGKKGPMAEYLRGLDLNRDAVAAFVAEPAKELMQGLSQEMARSAPPGMTELGKAPTYVKAATLTVNLFEADVLKLTVEGTDAKAAESLENIAKGLLGMLKGMYPQLREQVAKAPDGPPEDVKKTILDLGDQAVEGLSVDKSGDKIGISLRMKDSKAVAGLLPMFVRAVGDARKAALRAKRMNDLHQISLAAQNIALRMGRFPPAASRDPNGKPLLSWRVQLLPYLDQETLYREFRLNEPWDSEYNKKLIAKIPDVFRGNPGDGAPEGHTTVMVFTGDGTPFGVEKGVSLGQIRDGTSNTISFVIAGPNKAVPWTKPQDLPFDPANPIAALGKIPDRGFVAAMFDGSVRQFSKNIPAATLKALITHAGGETVDQRAIDGP